MTVADFVVNYLAEYGITKAFVVSGAANASLLDAFTRIKKIQYVAVMHEQAAGFAAEGYAKISGKPGVAMATSGPGGMNLVTPIGNCFYDSTPCLFITGQINSGFLRPDPAIRQVGFQETDIVSIVAPITKYAVMVTKAEDIQRELQKALFFASDGRPGPVLLDIPMDVQKKTIDPGQLASFDSRHAEIPFDLKAVEAQITRYLKDLAGAHRPALLIGGGIRTAGAVDALRELANVLKIPMFPTWNALDIVTSDDTYYGGRVGTYGGPGRNFGIQNADLLLTIGSRLSGRITGGNVKSFARAAKKYTVDVDRALLQTQLQQVVSDENIFCDAALFISMLKERLLSHAVPDFSSWTRRVTGWRDKYDPVLPRYHEQTHPANPYVFIKTLSDMMSKRDIFVTDCGGNVVISNHAFKTKAGQRYFTNNGNSPMGFSFAGALGAWFAAAPDQRVVCVIGDGGFNMNIQELQTLKTNGIKVKTFILNNHSYGIIKAYQDTNLSGRHEASGPESGYTPPDFVKISQAYDLQTFTISNNQEIADKISAVLEYDGPVVCDVDCGRWYDFQPRIFGFQTPIEDMYPYLPREEFRENMLIEPLEGWEKPQVPGGQHNPRGSME